MMAGCYRQLVARRLKSGRADLLLRKRAGTSVKNITNLLPGAIDRLVSRGYHNFEVDETTNTYGVAESFFDLFLLKLR